MQSPLLTTGEGLEKAVPYTKLVRSIFKLVPAIFVGRIGWVGMKVTDTSLLGHVSSRALTASAQSDLWTMAIGVLIQGRVLGIFVGNAVGAGEPKVGGEWLQVALAVVGVISMPVMALWALTGPVLHAFGEEDAGLVDDAQFFSLVLMACIPARVVFGALSQFFSAQGHVRPMMFVALSGLALNMILGLVLVLGWPVPGWSGFGFHACPVITSAVEWWQLLILVVIYFVCLKLHVTAWPDDGWHGWSARHVTRDRVCGFLKLYVPAALSTASDFWRMSVVGTLAATLGHDELAVFTASYRIMWISLTFVGSLVGGVGIELAQHLGGGRVRSAKRVLLVGLGLACVVLAGLTAVAIAFPRALGSIFSSDAALLDAFAGVRIPFALSNVVMNLAVLLEGMLMTTGRTRTVLIVGVLGSWAGQVPAVWLALHFWSQSLSAVYVGVAAGYGLLCVLLGAALLLLDWDHVAREAQQRAMPNTGRRRQQPPPQRLPEEQEQEAAAAAPTVEPRNASDVARTSTAASSIAAESSEGAKP